MSRLIDTLNRKNQSPAAFGFRAARTEAQAARLVLIASVKAGDGEIDEESIKGAHAVLVCSAEGRLTAKAAQAAGKGLDSIPWGIADNVDKPVSLPSACDFVLMSTSARPADAPKDEKTGRLLEVESSMDDGLLRALNELPVDAALVTDSLASSGELNWHQLMLFRHITRILSVPVIVPVFPGITAEDLLALWEAGVDGVLADAVDCSVSEIRDYIDRLPARSENKKRRSPALLPSIQGQSEPAAPAPEPDEEEEEDY